MSVAAPAAGTHDGRRLMRTGLRVAALAVILDQASKWWILSAALPCLSGTTGPDCELNSPSIYVTPFFNLVMAWNRGVSFGMFAHEADVMPYVLVAVALAIVGVMVVWLKRTDRMFQAVSIGAVIGGAIGNVVDRLRFGAVADFLDVHAFGWHWPAFNVADSFITVGVALLLLDGFRTGRPAPEQDKAGPAA
ncbi:MAG TPA: signal peptidase II [Azospirillaceae bacterium]|nr:signal peptidase II [Azospirillaceae bacterium]